MKLKDLFKRNSESSGTIRKADNPMKLDRNMADIYGNVNGLSLQNVFYTRNGYFPNCYMFTKPSKSGNTYFDAPAILQHLRDIAKKEDNMMSVVYTTYDIETKEERIGFSVIYPHKNLYARFENCISEAYILYGPNDGEALQWLVNEVVPFYKEVPPEENNIFLISQSATGFGLNKWDINTVEDFDIDKQYNEDFSHYNDVITDFIDNKDKSGLIILHGEKGTGKSTYIRHLVNSNPGKRFIFVHSGLINLLGEPSFNNFLISLSDSIIILEDCEDALKARKAAGSTAAVGILLNMTDGLLADTLHIKFICTFNEDISSIDDALLRKGRLVCKYEFTKLNKDRANALLSELYSDQIELDKDGNETKIETPTTNKPMSLADIYNYYSDSFDKKKSNFI